jgi:hypothetical protein
MLLTVRLPFVQGSGLIGGTQRVVTIASAAARRYGRVAIQQTSDHRVAAVDPDPFRVGRVFGRQINAVDTVPRRVDRRFAPVANNVWVPSAQATPRRTSRLA